MTEHNDAGTDATISLVPAPDDADQFSDAYQGELERVLVEAKAAGITLNPGYYMQESAGDFSGLTTLAGVFTAHAKDIGSILMTPLVAWLHGRYGRKVKLRIGDMEIEANNAKEVQELLEKAQAFKQATEPTRTHER